MSLAGPNRKPALTAAASKIGYSRQAMEKLKELPWQDRAWQVYEAEGSIYFMTRYRSAVARKIDYFAAIVESPGDDPTADATYNDEGELVSLGSAAKVLEAEGGPELIRRLVSELMVHWDVSGEAYLVRFDVEPFWRILSIQELKKQGNTYTWGDDTYQQGSVDPDGVFRVWKPHPRFHWEADSPTKHILEDAEELILLRRELKARSQSRLPSGAWVLPDTVDFTPFGEDENGTPDDFARELTNHMSMAVKDAGSAASLVPWILTVDRADHPLVVNGYVSFSRSWEVPMEQREALLRSIATGLDVPPEILTGMADLNHWSAWLVSEQAVSQHVAPTVDDILDSLTVNWFRPLLEAASVDPEGAVLWRDLSPATVPPDRTGVALDLFRENVISDTAVRRVSDFDEDDAPEIVEEGVMVMDAAELLQRINAFGVLRRAGAEWDDAVKAAGLPPIAQIPGLLPITVRAEEVVKNEEAVVSAIDDLLGDDPPLPGAAVTAAVRRRILATELSDIDSELLTWVQEQADKEIARLFNLALIAADDPLDESLLVSFAARLERKIAQAQAAARAWLTRITGRTPSDIGEDVARSQGVQTIVAGTLDAARRKLFTPDASPDPIDLGRMPNITTPTEAIRNGLSLAGGGPAVYEDGNTSELIGNGQKVKDELAGDGFFVDGYVWKYGHPANTFEPHLRLDGTPFLSWDDPKLAVNFNDGWLRRSFYAPGDHKGCCCAFIQEIVQSASASPDVGRGRPDEPSPSGAALTWEQFGVKLPTDPARRRLLNEALQRLNGLDPGVRERFIDLMGRFNGGVKFNVATASTKSITELGKVSEALRVVGGTALRKRSLVLQMSRQASEYDQWVQARNSWINGHERTFEGMKATRAEGRPPAGWPKNMVYTKFDELTPPPPQWRLATPDELADVIVHELGHANDFQLQIDAGAVQVHSEMPNGIFNLVRDMYHNSGDRIAAYEYAKSKPVEAIAELQRFFLRGIQTPEISLTASQWRLANPELASWIKENYLT